MKPTPDKSRRTITTTTKTEIEIPVSNNASHVLKATAAMLQREYEMQKNAKCRFFRSRSTADSNLSSDGLPHLFGEIYTFPEFFAWVSRGEAAWTRMPDNAIGFFTLG